MGRHGKEREREMWNESCGPPVRSFGRACKVFGTALLFAEVPKEKKKKPIHVLSVAFGGDLVCLAFMCFAFFFFLEEGFQGLGTCGDEIVGMEDLGWWFRERERRNSDRL
jgi:hypothetical protein